MILLPEVILDGALTSTIESRVTAPTELGQQSFELSGRPVAGIRITDDTALTYSTFFDCVRIISETVAQLPWHVFRSEGRYRIPQDEFGVDELLSKKVNPEMGARSFKEVMTIWALLRGNAYAEIEASNGGDPTALWLLNPSTVTPKRDTNGALIYEVKQGREEPVIIPAERMFHYRGPSPDGIVGWSIVKLAKESISLGLAMESFGAAFFGNGCWPGFALEHPGKPKEEARVRMRKELNEKHGGAKKARGPMILWEGMKVNTFSISPEDSQFLESRTFQVREICRWFRMQLSKVGASDAAKANMETQSVEFITDTIMPWVSRLEEEADVKLLPENVPGLFTKMNVNQFLRGNTQARSMFYKTMFSLGAFSPNDILALEDRNPIGPAGDMRFVPMNLVSIEQAFKDGNTAPKQAIPGGVSNESADLVGVVNNLIGKIGADPEGAGDGDPLVTVDLYRRAHFRIFEAVAKWLVAKEGKAHARAARRCSGDAAGFQVWQEGFYRKHTEEMIDAFGAPIDALCSLLAAGSRTNDEVRAVHKCVTAVCEREIADAQRQYLLAFGNLEVAECSQQREAEAPDRIAKTVMEALVREVMPAATEVT